MKESCCEELATRAGLKSCIGGDLSVGKMIPVMIGIRYIRFLLQTRMLICSAIDVTLATFIVFHTAGSVDIHVSSIIISLNNTPAREGGGRKPSDLAIVL